MKGKRKATEAAKTVRSSSWRRGQERKQQRREKQAAAERRNRQLRAEGKLTPWEAAKQRAKERKTGASLV